MKNTLFILLISTLSVAKAQIPEGFTPLFNEKDLSGWTRKGTSIPTDVWKWQDGVLITSQGSTGGYGWIQNDAQQFTDFEFYCEWKCGNNGNTGFQFDIPETAVEPVWEAIEIQMCEETTFTWWWEKNGYYKNDPRQMSGGIYPFVGASKNVYSGMDKWNTTLVKSYGDTIAVVLNGEEILKINRNDYTQDTYLWNERTALSKRPRSGYIGLQSHKGGISYFRNVAIKELGSTLNPNTHKQKENIEIYPNPMTDAFKINFNSNRLPNKHIQILDNSGKMVKQMDFDISEYNVSDLDKGMYFVQVYYPQQTQTLKLIKQ